MHKKINLKVDELQQQKIKLGSSLVNHKQESEAIRGTDSPRVDSRRLEMTLPFFFYLSLTVPVYVSLRPQMQSQTLVYG